LEYVFPDLTITILDLLPKCLGPLPESAAEYCSEYMHASGVREFYGTKYSYDDMDMWKKIGLPDKVPKDCIYECVGVKASTYFLPKEILSKFPFGGGWIYMNEYLQVTEVPPFRPPAPQVSNESLTGKLWGDGRFFAVGDCNFGCIGRQSDWDEGKGMPPIPKISYPGEEQALHAVKSIKRMDKALYPKCCGPKKPKLFRTWWPWGAGMFATSLGQVDACFVVAANHNKGSGYMVNWWWFAAIQKEIIETSKIDECADRLLGRLIWHFVHHTPIHLWGAGACWKCCCR